MRSAHVESAFIVGLAVVHLSCGSDFAASPNVDGDGDTDTDTDSDTGAECEAEEDGFRCGPTSTEDGVCALGGHDEFFETVCAPGAAPRDEGLFEDVHERVGLDGVVGRRVTWGDADGDRFPDFVAIRTGVARGLQSLYLSRAGADRGRVFQEVTESARITANRNPDADGQVAVYVVWGDVDSDGDLDLFSGSYTDLAGEDPGDRNEVYLNDGSGVFELALDSGLNDPTPRTGSAATFLDYDLDGALDLFVGNWYVQYGFLPADSDQLFRGGGDGTFSDVTAEAGILTEGIGGDHHMGAKPTYGVTSCDVDDDGWPDVLTSSYGLQWNDLWDNRGDGTFANASVVRGYDMDGQEMPGEPYYRQGGNTFATACGDFDNDGDLDVFTAETTHGDAPRNLADRSRLLVNTGAAGGFVFHRPDIETTGIERDIWADEGGNEGDHGVTWADFDNDGLLDLFIEQSAYPRNHSWLVMQNPDNSFRVLGEASGAWVVNSNGLSATDYDRDGDVDVLVGSVNTGAQQTPDGTEQVHLLENQVGTESNWTHVGLVGTASNRWGVGAKVTVVSGDLVQIREIPGGKGTYGAADPPEAHFGLGDRCAIDRIEVRWPNPDHTVQVFTNVAPNRFIEITEGSCRLLYLPPR